MKEQEECLAAKAAQKCSCELCKQGRKLVASNLKAWVAMETFRIYREALDEALKEEAKHDTK